MKKKEIIFIAGILAAALVLWGVMSFFRSGSCTQIRITVDGEEYGIYSLTQNQTIKIGDTNICEIKNGSVKMTEADCPDHLCMKQHAVGSDGGTIVCLPNKVVITGIDGSGQKTQEFDTVV